MQNIEIPKTKKIANKDDIVSLNGQEYLCLIDGLELPVVMTKQLFLNLEIEGKVRKLV